MGISDEIPSNQMKSIHAGGEGGIRTPDTVTRMPHFECGAFNHSATSPSLMYLGILRLDASAEGHLLPLCYHFFLEAPVYSLARREVNAGGSISLHSWQNVTIEVEGYSDPRMPEPLTGNLRMHVTGEQVCGMAVSEIVEPNTRQRGSRPELIPSVR